MLDNPLLQTLAVANLKCFQSLDTESGGGARTQTPHYFILYYFLESAARYRTSQILGFNLVWLDNKNNSFVPVPCG